MENSKQRRGQKSYNKNGSGFSGGSTTYNGFGSRPQTSKFNGNTNGNGEFASRKYPNESNGFQKNQ